MKEGTGRGISRYEHHYFEGWCVGLARGGRKWVRYFRDEPGTDGRERALERARRFRNALVAKIGAWTKIHRRSERSSTGVVGVTLVREVGKAGGVLLRFRASWPVVVAGKVGQRKIVSFSVAMWGRKQARDLAIAARRAGVARYVADGGPEACRVPDARAGRVLSKR